MTYIELNDEYNSIIDIRGIRQIHNQTVSDDCYYLKIHYSNRETYYSYGYRDIEALYEDRERIKKKLGF
jgi:hypothetical protein